MILDWDSIECNSKNIKAHEGNGYVFDYRVHIKSFPKTTKFAYRFLDYKEDRYTTVYGYMD